MPSYYIYKRTRLARTLAGFVGAGLLSGTITGLSLFIDQPQVLAATTTNQSNKLINEGLDQARQSKHFDAINKYSEAIKLNPGHHHAYFYRARSRKALADFENAVKDYNYVIKLNPKSSMAYTERGWCLRKLKLPKRAMHDFDMALKLNPKNTRALEYRASLKYKNGDFQGALGDLNQILKYKPNSSKQLAEFMLPRLNLVKTKKSVGATKDKIKISSADKSFDININTNKDHSKCDKKELAHINNLAAQAIKKGKFEQAVKLLQPITEKHPDYDYARKNLTIAYNNFGLKLARKNTREAADKFRSALYYSPSEGTARRNLNAILKDEGKNPRSYETRLELGNEQLRAGNPRLAFVEFTESLRLKNTASVRRKLAEACLQLENQNTKRAIAETPRETAESKTTELAKVPAITPGLEEKNSEEAEIAEAAVENAEPEKTETIAVSKNEEKTPEPDTSQNQKQQNELKEKLTALKLPAPASVTVQGSTTPQTLKGLAPELAPRIQLSRSDILKEWDARMGTGQDRLDQGDYVGAENSFDSAVQLAESLGGDSRELAMSLEKLAEVYLIHKKTSQAYSLLARALVILSRHHNVDDPILVKLRQKIDSLSKAMNRDGGTSEAGRGDGTSIATSE